MQYKEIVTYKTQRKKQQMFETTSATSHEVLHQITTNKQKPVFQNGLRIRKTQLATPFIDQTHVKKK